MNWREKLKRIAEFLKLDKKLEQKSLTNEEFQQIVDAYQKEYAVSLRDDVNAEAQQQAQQQAAQEQQQLLNQIYEAVVTAGGQKPETSQEPAASQQPATQQGIIEAINNLGERFQQMASRPDDDHAAQEGAAVIVPINGMAHTPEFLFGINAPMFSMELRWNRIMANPSAAAAMGTPTQEQEQAFHKAVRGYGQSLMQRMQYLVKNGLTDLKALAAGEFSTNYAGVDNLGDMGTQFTVRRQDAIIARVLSTRAMTDFFPVRYGIQDNDLIFNAFFDEVSQAWQAGPVYKGGMKIENERGYVDDAMIKMTWGPMKELERKYIAYLNTSGSDPIKWTMIEYQLLNSLLQAQREQNIRRMRGIYVAPETGVAGSYLHTSTGILYRLIDYIHSNKLLVTDDENKTYRTYNESTMLATVKAFVDDVVTHLGEDENLSGKFLYLNERHKPWWLKCIRTQFHLDNDFTGVESYANVVPDTEVHIIWLPYLGNTKFMMIHEPGNLQFLEFLPGEMMAMQMEQQMEMVRAWSTWKEGTAAAFLGKRFSSKAALVANDYEFQQIFLNKFCVDLSNGATKANAKDGFWFETGGSDDTYDFTSYNPEDTSEQWATGKVKILSRENNKTLVEVVENSVEGFVGNKYIVKTASANPNTLYVLYNEDGTTPAGVKVKIAATTASAITDIENAKAGVAYIIECGSTSNATTIAKSGKFSEISADWVPQAEGDYIMVVLNVAGTKFLELERMVNGVRTINDTLNPHYVG